MTSASGDRGTLLSNASATGATYQWRGGMGIFSVEGTFGGATVKLQYKSANGTLIDVGPDTTLTAQGAAGFILPRCLIQATVSGGSPSALFAYTEQM